MKKSTASSNPATLLLAILLLSPLCASAGSVDAILSGTIVTPTETIEKGWVAVKKRNDRSGGEWKPRCFNYWRSSPGRR